MSTFPRKNARITMKKPMGLRVQSWRWQGVRGDPPGSVRYRVSLDIRVTSNFRGDYVSLDAKFTDDQLVEIIAYRDSMAQICPTQGNMFLALPGSLSVSAMEVCDLHHVFEWFRLEVAIRDYVLVPGRASSCGDHGVSVRQFASVLDRRIL